MKTATLFINGRSQAMRIPEEFEFEGMAEVEICREGNTLIWCPARKSWTSFADILLADSNFMAERDDQIEDGQLVL